MSNNDSEDQIEEVNYYTSAVAHVERQIDRLEHGLALIIDVVEGPDPPPHIMRSYWEMQVEYNHLSSELAMHRASMYEQRRQDRPELLLEDAMRLVQIADPTQRAALPAGPSGSQTTHLLAGPSGSQTHSFAGPSGSQNQSLAGRQGSQTQSLAGHRGSQTQPPAGRQGSQIHPPAGPHGSRNQQTPAGPQGSRTQGRPARNAHQEQPAPLTYRDVTTAPAPVDVMPARPHTALPSRHAPQQASQEAFQQPRRPLRQQQPQPPQPPVPTTNSYKLFAEQVQRETGMPTAPRDSPDSKGCPADNAERYGHGGPVHKLCGYEIGDLGHGNGCELKHCTYRHVVMHGYDPLPVVQRYVANGGEKARQKRKERYWYSRQRGQASRGPAKFDPELARATQALLSDQAPPSPQPTSGYGTNGRGQVQQYAAPPPPPAQQPLPPAQQEQDDNGAPTPQTEASLDEYIKIPKAKKPKAPAEGRVVLGGALMALAPGKKTKKQEAEEMRKKLEEVVERRLEEEEEEELRALAEKLAQRRRKKTVWVDPEPWGKEGKEGKEGEEGKEGKEDKEGEEGKEGDGSPGGGVATS